MLMQRTVREKVSAVGVGLHSGKQTRLEILPAAADHGITFLRTDLPPHAELRASIDHVADTTLATTIAVGVNGSRAQVGTVEHLMAALVGAGIDNARVHVDGPEVPVFDGSAAAFVEMLDRVGTEAQRHPKRFLVIKREVRVKSGQSEARIAPGHGYEISCSVDFDHPLIPPTPFRFRFDERAFRKEVAPARTFGFLEEVEMLRERGLAKGGSLDNAIVIDQYRVLNPEGLRFPDEFVRHKTLDAIGDLALFGMPVVGRVKLHRSGHALNTELVRAVLSDHKAFEIVEPARQAVDRAPFAAFEAVESIA